MDGDEMKRGEKVTGGYILLRVFASASPSLQPQFWKLPPRLAGRSPPQQSAFHQKKSVLNRAEPRMGCSPDEVFPTLESPASPGEGWSTPSASYSKHS